MISGECSVEGLSGTDHEVLLKGLRLRLDLRIVPRVKGKDAAGGEAAAAGVWRIEDARVATLPLGVPVAYQRAALVSGIAVLALSIGVWLASPSTATHFDGAESAAAARAGARLVPSAGAPTPEAAPVPHAARAAAPEPNGSARALPSSEVPAAVPSSASHALGGAAALPQGVAPRISPYDPGAAPAASTASPPPSVSAASAPVRAAQLGAAPAPTPSAALANAPAAAHRAEPSSIPRSIPESSARLEGAVPARARASSASPAASMSQREMLDLFGDTK